MTLYKNKTPLWFSSGLQYEAEIKAMIHLKVPCGISLDTASNTLFKYLIEQHSKVPALFIDSGAFSEKPHKPFTFEDWQGKLAKYQELANVYHNKCVFVAPDKIGDQAESLRRLNAHRDFLSTLIERSHMIVPLQKGELTQAQMYAEVVKLFNRGIVAGIPFKKAATTYDEYFDFMRTAKPSRVHILGVTPFGARWRRINEINQQFTKTRFTFDGCRIRSIVGQGQPFTLGMHARKHLSRSEAIYETLISLPHCFSLAKNTLDGAESNKQLELFSPEVYGAMSPDTPKG